MAVPSTFGPSNPGLGVPGQIRPGYPGVPPAAPAPPPEPVVIGQWNGSMTRWPIGNGTGQDFPPWLGFSVRVSNTAGNWMFACAAWRQDNAQSAKGVIGYQGSVNISDDARNFWIPVFVTPPQEDSVVRCAIWMAPAARAAERVFLSPLPLLGGGYPPEPYFAAITLQIFEFSSACPWYDVSVYTHNEGNQVTSNPVSLDPPDNVFALLITAWDNITVSWDSTYSGWTFISGTSVDNGSDRTGDMRQRCWYGIGGASALTFDDSLSADADMACVAISVQGVSNVLPYPYVTPLENWPTLVTEIACGPVQNADPAFQFGTDFYTAVASSASASSTVVFNPWPDYGVIYSSAIEVIPNGSADNASLTTASYIPVTPGITYQCMSWVYSPNGFGNGSSAVAYAGITWYDDTHTEISISGFDFTLLPAQWTQMVTGPVFPPENAAYALAYANEFSSPAPSSADTFYVGYLGFGPAQSYENEPPDSLCWSDLSGRTISLDDIQVSRGIQYEQQGLEAGTMSLTLANSDGNVTYGNMLATYWPDMGDTDVPVRLRAIWPGMICPYVPLFSGYTDQVEIEWDPETWFGTVRLTASDAWSRLTAQNLVALYQEIFTDGPLALWSTSQSGANIAPGSVTPVVNYLSQNTALAGGAQVTFNGDTLPGLLVGASGESNWQVTGLTGSSSGNAGYGLGWFPASPVMNTSGLTLEFWFSPMSGSSSQPPTDLTLCSCWSQKGLQWSLQIDNATGAADSNLYMVVYDKVSGDETLYMVGTLTFLTTAAAAEAWFVVVEWTTTSVSVYVSSGAGTTESFTGSANFASQVAGFSWAGNAGPFYQENLIGTLGFCNMAIYGIALFGYLVPVARYLEHFNVAQNALPGETDLFRLARVIGYSGFSPVLAMEGADQGDYYFAPDTDGCTAITDTNGQVVSSYLTNIASSTLAGMFMDGAGAFNYRRRLQWYSRAIAQRVLGESPLLPLNSNGSFTRGVSGWTTSNSASLSSSLEPSGRPSPVFLTAGVFAGSSLISAPAITWGASGQAPASAGNWYEASCWIWSPQGWNGGVYASVNFWSSGNSLLGSQESLTYLLSAGSAQFLDSTPAQAPASTAYVTLSVTAAGTPGTTPQFYVSGALLAQVPVVSAPGPGYAAPEAPFLADLKLSADRSQLYNYAILNQYGTETSTTYSGPDLIFQPTSGITVTEVNQSSINQRGQVAYSTTLYTENTLQSPSYALNLPSMEDFGNWIVNTLGSAVLRAETVTTTPAATAQALTTILQAEIGDTVTLRRRPLGAQEIQLLAYCSKLSYTVNIGQQKFSVEMELTPFGFGQVVRCDDLVHGCLSGGPILGW